MCYWIPQLQILWLHRPEPAHRPHVTNPYFRQLCPYHQQGGGSSRSSKGMVWETSGICQIEQKSWDALLLDLLLHPVWSVSNSFPFFVVTVFFCGQLIYSVLYLQQHHMLLLFRMKPWTLMKKMEVFIIAHNKNVFTLKNNKNKRPKDYNLGYSQALGKISEMPDLSPDLRETELGVIQSLCASDTVFFSTGCLPHSVHRLDTQWGTIKISWTSGIS